MRSRWLSDFERDGIVTVPDVIDSEAAGDLVAHLVPLVGDGAGDRSLHEDSRVRELAQTGPLAELAAKVLGDGARIVRVLYFDKHPGANWKVPYHQDVTIAVRDRVETPGFTGWSTKAGMNHVRAPKEVLENMLAVRLHLDECGPENGPLRAISGSHLAGKLSKPEVALLIEEREERTYTSPIGGVVLMRPLTLHASSQAISPNHRRVIHVEYAGSALPQPLAWALGWVVQESSASSARP
jgi:hypothetical protein